MCGGRDGGDDTVGRSLLDGETVVAGPRNRLQVFDARCGVGCQVVLLHLVIEAPHTGLFERQTRKGLGVITRRLPDGLDDLFAQLERACHQSFLRTL